MDLSLFDYSLPRELIAQRPLDDRGGSRLMVLSRHGREHASFSDLPDFLGDGDLLVLNDTRVLPVRLWGRKETGGRVEVLLVNEVEGGAWRAMVGGGNLKPGQEISIDGAGALVELARKEGEYWLVRFPEGSDVGALMESTGEMPTPPYIKEKLADGSRYQTVYASEGGSIAAPTAGLHFTNRMLRSLEEKGIGISYITLHVGPGTFRPVRAARVEEHEMEGELVTISPETVEAIERNRESGGRLVAVGTTTMRALEGAMARGPGIEPGRFWTDIFIYPGWRFRAGVDVLLTNFHLPRSTLLMLVSAFHGRERVLEAYSEAVEMGYRFYSFGDAMLMEAMRDV